MWLKHEYVEQVQTLPFQVMFFLCFFRSLVLLSVRGQRPKVVGVRIIFGWVFHQSKWSIKGFRLCNFCHTLMVWTRLPQHTHLNSSAWCQLCFEATLNQSLVTLTFDFNIFSVHLFPKRILFTTPAFFFPACKDLSLLPSYFSAGLFGAFSAPPSISTVSLNFTIKERECDRPILGKKHSIWIKRLLSLSLPSKARWVCTFLKISSWALFWSPASANLQRRSVFKEATVFQAQWRQTRIFKDYRKPLCVTSIIYTAHPMEVTEVDVGWRLKLRKNSRSANWF